MSQGNVFIGKIAPQFLSLSLAKDLRYKSTMAGSGPGFLIIELFGLKYIFKNNFTQESDSLQK